MNKVAAIVLLLFDCPVGCSFNRVAVGSVMAVQRPVWQWYY